MATDKILETMKEECIDEKKEFTSMTIHGLMDALLHKCITVKSSSNVDKSRFNKCHWGFIIGRHINAIEFDFFKDKGVYEGDVNDSGKPQWQKAIYNIAEESLVMVDAEYVGTHKYYCLSVSEMSSNGGKEINIDQMFDYFNNHGIMYQYVITLGNYKYGNLVCKTKEG